MNMYLSDIMESVVSGMSPILSGTPTHIYYQFGYWPEVANDLMSKGKSPILGSQRYPFIMLSAGWTEKRNGNRAFFAEVAPSIYIVTTSQKNYSTEQRKELTYKLILDPIYDSLLLAMQRSRYFWVKDGLYEHDKTDLYYLQNMDSNQNKLNDIVDAIEIKFKDLKILKKNFECSLLTNRVMFEEGEHYLFES